MKLLLLGLPLLFILLIFLYFTIPWVLIYMGNLLEPNPPGPAVTYGEFPFRLEYEINGKKKVIQDTLIVEYKGVGMNEGQGKFRKWEQRLASGNENITLFKNDNSLEIYYPPGSSRYYMDDLGDGESFSYVFPNAAYTEIDGRITRSGVISADDLLKLYNIKLISWDYTQPIKNDFSSNK
ncbi:hypothetical protein ACFOQM_11225 [Paenibacillus sp. GCM10012307]|uniref:Uncharacterized protein n=1 Tax=Paenibacillus roseus TaxID=2798579 RepID=A0A934ML71_9BACL|nr:hypothetical protein [Paenibacillus roseus]MBJ6361855.1 hypothetical protein [Paenibacillus roseus]